MVKTIELFLEKRRYVLQVFIFFCAVELLSIIPAVLSHILDADMNKPIRYSSLNIVTLTVITPLIETAINQLAVFWLLNKSSYFKNNRLIVILISAAFFGIMHTYSAGYTVYAFLTGIMLAYIFSFYKDNYTKAYWTTFTVHALHNLVIFFLISNLK